jgi:hypothetical protein
MPNKAKTKIKKTVKKNSSNKRKNWMLLNNGDGKNLLIKILPYPLKPTVIDYQGKWII